MKKFKVIKDKDSFAIYKCWLWIIVDENGISPQHIPPYYASKEKALIQLKTLIKNINNKSL
tara:strand:+ start:371 stop:553 length:183 start_codon:yes stop_codon:yes gene_type:complete